MAGLVNLTPKPVTVQGYQLLTPADMVAALDYLKAGGYTGTINLAVTGNVAAWQMWLQHSARGTSQSAVIGDWVAIENNSVARIVPQANFANQYNTP